MKILLVEDNEAIIMGLQYAFEAKGYQMQAFQSYSEARRYLSGLLRHSEGAQKSEDSPDETESADLIVLDIGLPDGSGMDLFETYVRPLRLLAIFLTAVDEEETVVKALDLGADDYVTKPFSTKELLARVNRALLRYKKESVLQIRQISFDMDKMVVTRDGRPVEFTSLELKMFHLLCSNLNQVLTRTVLLDKIWEWTGNDVDDHTVTVYMKRIREKVGDGIVTTVRGIGYRIDR